MAKRRRPLSCKWVAQKSSCHLFKRYGMAAETASSGALAVETAFRGLKCDSLRLFGFGLDNGSDATPYHYWKDGSVLDGVSEQSWYISKSRWTGTRTGHQFAAEHRYLFEVGKGSWTLHRHRFLDLCGTQEAECAVSFPRSRVCPLLQTAAMPYTKQDLPPRPIGMSNATAHAGHCTPRLTQRDNPSDRTCTFGREFGWENRTRGVLWMQKTSGHCRGTYDCCDGLMAECRRSTTYSRRTCACANPEAGRM